MKVAGCLLMAVIMMTPFACGMEQEKDAALRELSHALDGKIRISVRDEATGKIDGFDVAPAALGMSSYALDEVGLAATVCWRTDIHGLMMEITISGDKKRVGHELIIDLPVLQGREELFTPGDRGVVSLAAHPTLQATEYGAFAGYATLRHYVIPLASAFNLKKDTALTMALAPTENIPHLLVEWMDAKNLRFGMKHRAMGGNSAATLTMRFYTHPADYRSALKAYSDEFPRYFKPVMPRSEYEGPFWYHHIHAHPDFEEMARQNMRYIWMSFWFTHLGEYLPQETEWAPYTYASWFKLGEMMSDEKIRAFVRKMHEHGIGAYAYFNVTEYGGKGGAGGDAKRAERILREQFADALFKNSNGDAIGTWEGAMVMNAGRDYSLFPFLVEQVRRHITRLPEIDGFIIDRLDWASKIDYGHHDGMTMIGDREVENMVWPVSTGVGEVLRQSHAAGKRVFVNQHWKVELLKDVDGTCHESDFLPGQGYLSPYRPSSSWTTHHFPYHDDLLKIESHMKKRLQYALLPHMIAHEFPICQEPADPEAADLMELYAPLFAALDGKEQILLPHCVEATGANEVNLYVNRQGHYVAPLTSQVRFLSRRPDVTEAVTVRLNVPDAEMIKSAYVVSADADPAELAVSHNNGRVEATVPKHGTASMVVFCKTAEPEMPQLDNARFADIRQRVFPVQFQPGRTIASRPQLPEIHQAVIHIKGNQLKFADPVTVMHENTTLGQLTQSETALSFAWPASGSKEAPAITLVAGDESVWYAPTEIAWLAKRANGKIIKVARWTPAQPVERAGRYSVKYILQWIEPAEIVAAQADFIGRDATLGGNWPANMASQGYWTPGVNQSVQNGFEVHCSGKEHVWRDDAAAEDQRVLHLKNDPKTRRAACWFTEDEMVITVSSASEQPYRLSVYLLDYDRAGREQELRLYDQVGEVIDQQRVSRREMADGVYLTWKVTGPVRIKLQKLVGENAVVSGIFIGAGELP